MNYATSSTWEQVEETIAENIMTSAPNRSHNYKNAIKTMDATAQLVRDLPDDNIGGLTITYSEQDIEQTLSALRSNPLSHTRQPIQVSELLLSENADRKNETLAYLQGEKDTYEKHLKSSDTIISAIAAGSETRWELNAQGIYPLAILPTKVAERLIKVLCPQNHYLYCRSENDAKDLLKKFYGLPYKLHFDVKHQRGRGEFGDSQYFITGNIEVAGTRYKISFDSISRQRDRAKYMNEKASIQEIMNKVTESHKDWKGVKRELYHDDGEFLKTREELLLYSLQKSIGLQSPLDHHTDLTTYEVNLPSISSDHIVSSHTNVRKLLSSIIQHRTELNICLSAHSDAYKISSLENTASESSVSYAPVKMVQNGDPILLIQPKSHPHLTAFCMQYGDFPDEKEVIGRAKELDIPQIIEN